MYYAINDKNEVIAEDRSFSACADKAVIASKWDQAPGTVAPYHITNWKPKGY